MKEISIHILINESRKREKQCMQWVIFFLANDFLPLKVPAENVQMQYNGDVLVPFYSQELAIKALHEKQRQYTGKMELFMPWE